MLIVRRLALLTLFCGILLPGTSWAQITEVGSDASLDIATWNIEWFGSSSNGPSNDDVQVQNVADIVSGSGIDLWALQEIAETNRFAELLSLLPDYWEGFLATQSGVQRVGYLYDSRIMSLRNSTHILTDFSFEFAGRPPLRAEFNVTLPDTAFVATFINVHMKAFSDASSYARRVEAARRIKNHIDFTSLATAPVFFLGDFNDEMNGSTHQNQTSPYQPYIDDPQDYTVLTHPLETAGGASFQSGSFLDHIIVTNEAADMWVQGSTQVLTNLVSVNSFYARTSDHIPVVASFASSVVTSTEPSPEIPDAPLLSSVWPNPSTGQLAFTVSSADLEARVRVTDMLGRVLFEGDAKPGLNRLDLLDMASGVVSLQIVTNQRVESQSVLILR